MDNIESAQLDVNNAEAVAQGTMCSWPPLIMTVDEEREQECSISYKKGVTNTLVKKIGPDLAK